MNYTIFDKNTGQIKSIVSTSEDQLSANYNNITEDYIEGFYLDTNYYIDTVSKQPVVIPTQPSPAYVWSWGSKIWIDPRTLEDLKSEKWEEIKALRKQKLATPLITPYGIFDSDQVSRTNIINAFLFLKTLSDTNPTATVDFTLYDNTVVSLNLAQITEVSLLLGQKIDGVYSTTRNLRQQIELSQSPQEVASISWPED